jgi:hypothetical protein
MSILDTLKTWYKDKSLNGINFFYANDKSTKQPSSTLFYAYVSFGCSVISLVVLHFKPSLLPVTGMAFFLYGLSVVFYMIRKINKASVSLKDQSFNLENNESKSNEK